MKMFRDVHHVRRDSSIHYSECSEIGSDDAGSSIDTADVDNDNEDDDDVSVGCESPPPPPPLSPDESCSSSGSPKPLRLGQVISTINQNLKFSIDNILKPEFGGPPAVKAARRISESGATGAPPKIPVQSSRKLAVSQAAESSRSPPPPSNTAEKCSPIDLSKESSAPPPTIPPSSNDTSKTSDNSKMWPAWVYCTRYSDRPSSGKHYTQ